MLLRLFIAILLNYVTATDKYHYSAEKNRHATEKVNNFTKTYSDYSSKAGNKFFQYYYDAGTSPPYDSLDDFGIEEEYDFIIVGSGSAGSVLANRLSEVPEWKILLIELGKEPPNLIDIPAIGDFFQFTDFNWGYLMEHQKDMCLGLANERMHWPRGRGLGGTTLINYMIHIRGNHLDYDRIAAMGNKGWAYKDVLPYFIKSEDYHVLRQDEGFHKHGGFLGVQDVPYRSRAVSAFVKAVQEYGYDYVDYNGRQQMGVSYVHATTRRGKRSSALRAFLDTARNRPNLKILTQTKVTQILIDRETKHAYGVKFVRNRKTFYVKARKEVLVSAGALSSPQLLMLSGIGPKRHLEELHIPVLKDLPVGQKLYDHITYLGLVFTVNQSIVILSNSTSDPNAFVELAWKGTGPLTNIGGVESLAFIRTPMSRDPDPTYPDMELIFIGAGLHSDRGEFYRRTFRVSDRSYDAIWKPIEGKYAFSIWPMLFHPLSSGSVRLKNKNPLSWPRFYGNYFTDPEGFDIRTLLAGIREAQKVAKMPAFQKYDARQVDTPVPGCEHIHYDTDEYWLCALRHLTVTLHHQIATCKMGPPNDPEAVVDDNLRVYGVKNLRVIDTSIIPMPLTAHTNIPTYMIGEKASDMIKGDWLGAQLEIQPRAEKRPQLPSKMEGVPYMSGKMVEDERRNAQIAAGVMKAKENAKNQRVYVQQGAGIEAKPQVAESERTVGYPKVQPQTATYETVNEQMDAYAKAMKIGQQALDISDGWVSARKHLGLAENYWTNSYADSVRTEAPAERTKQRENKQLQTEQQFGKKINEYQRKWTDKSGWSYRVATYPNKEQSTSKEEPTAYQNEQQVEPLHWKKNEKAQMPVSRWDDRQEAEEKEHDERDILHGTKMNYIAEEDHDKWVEQPRRWDEQTENVRSEVVSTKADVQGYGQRGMVQSPKWEERPDQYGEQRYDEQIGALRREWVDEKRWDDREQQLQMNAHEGAAKISVQKEESQYGEDIRWKHIAEEKSEASQDKLMDQPRRWDGRTESVTTDGVSTKAEGQNYEQKDMLQSPWWEERTQSVGPDEYRGQRYDEQIGAHQREWLDDNLDHEQQVQINSQGPTETSAQMEEKQYDYRESDTPEDARWKYIAEEKYEARRDDWTDRARQWGGRVEEMDDHRKSALAEEQEHGNRERHMAEGPAWEDRTENGRMKDYREQRYDEQVRQRELVDGKRWDNREQAQRNSYRGAAQNEEATSEVSQTQWAELYEQFEPRYCY